MEERRGGACGETVSLVPHKEKSFSSWSMTQELQETTGNYRKLWQHRVLIDPDNVELTSTPSFLTPTLIFSVSSTFRRHGYRQTDNGC